MGTKYGCFEQDLPDMIPTKQQFIVPHSFSGDFFFYFSNQKQEVTMVAMFAAQLG